MKRITKWIITWTAFTTIIGFSASFTSATAAQKPEPPTNCEEYAKSGLSDWDWVCVGGIVTRQREGKSVTENLAKNSAMSRKAQPQSVIDSYTSNVTEVIFVNLGGKAYTIPMTLKTRIYNHSPRLTMTYNSKPASGVTFKIRIREDRSFELDRTVFTYPGTKGSATARTTWTGTEDQYGSGYNRLPYDGKKYFINLYSIRISKNGRAVNAVGTVQSDRMTCYKTTSCKFKK